MVPGPDPLNNNKHLIIIIIKYIKIKIYQHKYQQTLNSIRMKSFRAL